MRGDVRLVAEQLTPLGTAPNRSNAEANEVRFWLLAVMP